MEECKCDTCKWQWTWTWSKDKCPSVKECKIVKGIGVVECPKYEKTNCILD